MGNKEELANISLKLRKIENLHIVFWLVKDMSWCMLWRELGMIMILPTLAVSIYLMLKCRKQSAELIHNIAITLWILANSTWMVSEFYKMDDRPVFFNLLGKELAFVFFLLGVICLIWYYGLSRLFRLFARKKSIPQPIDDPNSN